VTTATAIPPYPSPATTPHDLGHRHTAAADDDDDEEDEDEDDDDDDEDEEQPPRSRDPRRHRRNQAGQPGQPPKQYILTLQALHEGECNMENKKGAFPCRVVEAPTTNHLIEIVHKI
jgi:hypothetical protein